MNTPLKGVKYVRNWILHRVEKIRIVFLREKILFFTGENKIHIAKPLWNFLFITKTNRLCAQRTSKMRDMTSSIFSLVMTWIMRHSGPGCNFV